MGKSAAGLKHVGAEGGGPFVLIGPPMALNGELRVCNRGEAKVILRDLWLRGASPSAKAGKGKAARPPALPPLDQPLRRLILRPGEARRVPVQIALDRGTPPGEYPAEFQVAGERYPVQLHVTEVVDLELSPDELVIEAAPGAKVTKRVVMTNAGNVALKIGKIGAVPLDEEWVHCRVHRGALGEVGDKIESLNDYVSALGRHYKSTFDATAALRISNPAVSLAPSQVKSVNLTIQLPAKLLRRTRYFASVPIYSSTLGLTIIAV